jgi:hypothetical protein
MVARSSVDGAWDAVAADRVVPDGLGGPSEVALDCA